MADARSAPLHAAMKTIRFRRAASLIAVSCGLRSRHVINSPDAKTMPDVAFAIVRTGVNAVGLEMD